MGCPLSGFGSNYNSYRNYVHEALSDQKPKNGTSQVDKIVFRKELAVLEAEAQYVLAHRIAIEQKDYRTRTGR